MTNINTGGWIPPFNFDDNGNLTGADIQINGADGWLNPLHLNYDLTAGTVTFAPGYIASIIDNRWAVYSPTDDPRNEGVTGTVEVSADGDYTIKIPEGFSVWNYDTENRDFVAPIAGYSDVVIRFTPLKLGAINSVAADVADSDAPVEYFNLQGMRVSNPAPGTVVIRRQGTEVTKLLVR